MNIEAGKEYRSRRGERVLVTEVEPTGLWPVHFIVMDGPYSGVGKRDGSRLMINGRSTGPRDGKFIDHANDLVAQWPGNANVSTFSTPHPSARSPARDQRSRQRRTASG